ncbi:hypothetical protein XELAEV_18029205mg [Xenopus laevis]|uniref:Uncharacterized protein n=1 Tax=Xenopus laevis TaxID=8355 RepID=A0A974CTI9_XENLA|nr:hypothetical protein XELAEV_18029205mg [Xenopus laevis]
MPDWTLNSDAVDSLATCEASLTSSRFNIGQVGTHSPTLWHLQHGTSMWLGTFLFICLTLLCCNIKTSCLSLCGTQKTLVSFTEDFVGASFAPGNSPALAMCCCPYFRPLLRKRNTELLLPLSQVLQHFGTLSWLASSSSGLHEVSLTSGVFTTLAVRTLSQSLWNCIHQ